MTLLQLHTRQKHFLPSQSMPILPKTIQDKYRAPSFYLNQPSSNNLRLEITTTTCSERETENGTNVFPGKLKLLTISSSIILIIRL